MPTTADILNNEQDVSGSKNRISDARRRRIERLARERVRRRRSFLSLYEPLPRQLQYHKSQARERILRGSNRGAKTHAGMAEIAMVVSNRHPWRNSPSEGVGLLVGPDEKHLSTVMWRKLSKPNPNVRMVRDRQTGKWRNYRPWSGSYAGITGDGPLLKSETVPMEAMLPERMIEHIVWNKEGMGVPRRVVMATGWDLWFYTGAGKPPPGIDVDFIHFDEEITNEEWYTEAAARLLDRKGWFAWSATAQQGGDALWNLHVRALEQMEWPQPFVEEFEFLLEDNPYIDDVEKNLLADKYKHDQEAYRVRILGQYAVSGYRLYPTFSQRRHECEPFPVPADWCRYAIVDPGHSVCAVLFFAVPPADDQRHQHRYVYKELYLRECDEEVFGREFAASVGADVIEDVLIDDCGSRRSDTATGTKIIERYSRQLRRHRIRSRRSGHWFTLGSANVEAGQNALREWLWEAKDCRCAECADGGKPILRIMRGHAVNFVMEMERAVKKRQPNGRVTDKADNRKAMHCCDCARYAAMHGLKYVAPPLRSFNRVAAYLKKKRRRKRKPEDNVIWLAGGRNE